MSMEDGGMTEISALPKNWDMVNLSQVFKLTSGASRPKDISETRSEKMPYPIYGGNGILGYTDQFVIDKESIVIGRGGEYCGSIHRAPRFSWITDNALYASDILLNNMNLDFLIYELTFINLNQFKKISGQPLMTQTIINSIKIPLPPLPEQRRIAEVLGIVDSAIQKVGGAIESTERLKKGLMQRLLTRGIGHERFGSVLI
jgi:type I restriction enzyme S subunit